MVALAEQTRDHPQIALGISTRGLLALSKMVRAYAYVTEKTFVTPDMVLEMLPYVFIHRMILRGGLADKKALAKQILEDLAKQVTAPTENFEKN